jgi:hypothetical protein
MTFVTWDITHSMELSGDRAAGTWLVDLMDLCLVLSNSTLARMILLLRLLCLLNSLPCCLPLHMFTANSTAA